jgi:lysozyme family protein
MEAEMRSNFDKCLAMLMKHEGGFVNHPRDPGGMTNLGVTQAVYEQTIGRKVTEWEMRNLRVSDVAEIYRKQYWNRCRCDQLPGGVDWAVFDWSVNSGVSRASRGLQKSVSALPDGQIGPLTLQAVANFDPVEIIDSMHAIRQRFYERLATFNTFGRGWTARNNATREQALAMV